MRFGYEGRFQRWSARNVSIRHGPFKGEKGTVQIYLEDGRCKVYMATRNVELWFRTKDLRLI